MPKKVPEAVDTLKKALDLEPKNPNALNSLGYIYAEEKMDPAKAVSLCRQAVDLAPRNAAYLDSLGWAFFRQGSLLDARANFRRALDLAPGNKEIAAHIRLCMDALKDVKTP
jgi:Flp pilus assembly protein TadD